MDKILSINTIKNVFSALGAKTSDSNYGVALLDKTSGEPKGLMGMSDLASVLGVMNKGEITNVNPTEIADGLYFGSSLQGLPSDANTNGMLLKFDFFLFYAPYNREFVLTRSRTTAGWQSWRKIEGTVDQ